MATERRTAAQRRAAGRKRQREAIQARRVTASGDDPTVIQEFSRPELGLYLRRLKRSVQVRLTLEDGEPFFNLMGIAAAREILDGLEASNVESARARGLSWDDVGFALNVSGEAARKRLGKYDAP